MHAMTFDIAGADRIAAFADELLFAHPHLNVVFNNAGIMRYEPLDRRPDLADAEATITTNLLGTIRLTNALIDHLAGQPNVAIVNTTSGLAFMPLVASPTYNATKAGIHSYTVAMREALCGKVEVSELARPAVQTKLTPGQESNAMFLPLDDFVDEVMDIFRVEPTPAEILVERVVFQRFAEAENRFDDTLAKLNRLAQ